MHERVILDQTARRVGALYYEAAYSRASKWRKPEIGGSLRRATDASLEAFRKAAAFAEDVGASPHEHVSATFAAFDVATGYVGRPLLPRPGHLATLSAVRRTLAARGGRRRVETEAALIVRSRRCRVGGEPSVVDVEVQISAERLERRKLASLARFLGVPEEEVLRRCSSEFSQAFLDAA